MATMAKQKFGSSEEMFKLMDFLQIPRTAQLNKYGYPIAHTIKLTRAVVRKWFELQGLNNENRNVSGNTGYARMLTDEMNNGKWRFLNKDIKIKTNGMIGDSGTTLFAFYNSQLTELIIPISFGWSDDDINVMDCGRKRSMLNAIQMGMDGIPEATSFMVSIANHAYAGDSRYAITNGQVNSRNRNVKFIYEYFKALKELQKVWETCTRGIGKLKSGPIWRAILNYYLKEPERALIFASAFATGADVLEKADAAIVFRGLYVDSVRRNDNKFKDKGTLYRQTCNYLYAFHKEVSYLKSTSYNEAYEFMKVS